jgi:hypothetical protein
MFKVTAVIVNNATLSSIPLLLRIVVGAFSFSCISWDRIHVGTTKRRSRTEILLARGALPHSSQYVFTIRKPTHHFHKILV